MNVIRIARGAALLALLTGGVVAMVHSASARDATVVKLERSGRISNLTSTGPIRPQFTLKTPENRSIPTKTHQTSQSKPKRTFVQAPGRWKMPNGSSTSAMGAGCLPEVGDPSCIPNLGDFEYSYLSFDMELWDPSSSGQESYVVDVERVERVDVTGRRLPERQTVCLNGFCREYDDITFIDLQMIEPLERGGVVDAIIEFILGSPVAKIDTCRPNVHENYRQITRDTPDEIRLASARGLYFTLYPNTISTDKIEAEISWSDGTVERYAASASAPFRKIETSKVGDGRPGSAC